MTVKLKPQKKMTGVTIDIDLWEAAKRHSINLSSRINACLRRDFEASGLLLKRAGR